MIALSHAALSRLPGEVAVPAYDRRALRAGIVHIGVGNFHRTHQAVYVDDCLHRPGNEAWGICGIGLTDGPAARAKADAYRAQDGLYTVSEFAPDGTAKTRVIGAMVDYLHAPADPEAVLARLAHPNTRIVTLTITEGGYNIGETDGRFMLDTPEVAHDLGAGPPRSVFGFLVEALARRRAAGLPAFTIASCDNLRGNGDTARRAVVSFAQARDRDLAEYIDREVDFPNSMVDRIAPQIPEAERQALNALSGVDDRLPAKAESFNQWVVEDSFRQGRPPLEEIGVEFRDDVAAYVSVKGRMINACHMLLAYPSVLMGRRLVHEGMRDPRMVALLGAFLDRDVIPHVTSPPGLKLDRYKGMIVERFSNPAIGDQLLRVAGDGAAKLPIFHGKTIATLVAAGADLRREAFLLACFARYLEGRDDTGTDFPVVEPGLTPDDWAEARAEPAGVLRMAPFSALGLADHRGFRAAFDPMAGDLARQGTSKTLDALVGQD
ncbi:MAG TPA: mannitol dehydrogenase family protein [Lichenihabitans sp.]|jgi:mannitol-1-phosphate/altronate dehydrogenase|nr:mannitol dehydrogenase family protein [Lichenihabitans sp.]